MSRDSPRDSHCGHFSIMLAVDPGDRRLAEWDRLVTSTEGADVAQLSCWARFRRHYGFQSQYVFVQQYDRIVGGALVLHRRVGPFGRLAYVPFGPVISARFAHHPHIVEELAHELASMGRRQFRMLVVQPSPSAAEVSQALLDYGFRASTHALVTPGSVRLDTAHDEDTLRASLPSALRRSSRRWERDEVRVRTGDRFDIPLLVNLMANTAEHQGFAPLPAEYVHKLYDSLAPSGCARIFVGEVRGDPQAAVLITRCGPSSTFRLGGIDRSGPAVRLQVAAAIHWEIIRWCQRHGCRWYDLGGVSEDTLLQLANGAPRSDEAIAGADRFKLQFSDEPYRNPTTVELIRPWALRRSYDIVRRSERGRTLVSRMARLLRSGTA